MMHIIQVYPWTCIAICCVAVVAACFAGNDFD